MVGKLEYCVFVGVGVGECVWEPGRGVGWLPLGTNDTIRWERSSTR